MTLKALIWDVDGTLTESEEAHRAAFNRAFVDFELPWHWDQVLYSKLLGVAGGKERIAHYIRDFHKSWSDDNMQQNLVSRVHARKTEHYAELVRTGRLTPRPGVKRLLTEARDAGLKLAIATTTTPANVTMLLDSLFDGLDLRWTAIAAGDLVRRKKPAPDVYLLALMQLGLSATECLAVEDSRLGLLSATSAGISTLVTPSTYTRGENFDEALAVVEHLGDADTPCVLPSGHMGMVDLPLLKETHSC